MSDAAFELEPRRRTHQSENGKVFIKAYAAGTLSPTLDFQPRIDPASEFRPKVHVSSCKGIHLKATKRKARANMLAEIASKAGPLLRARPLLAPWVEASSKLS